MVKGDKEATDREGGVLNKSMLDKLFMALLVCFSISILIFNLVLNLFIFINLYSFEFAYPFVKGIFFFVGAFIFLIAFIVFLLILNSIKQKTNKLRNPKK